jgi:hypothetical protein
MTCRGTLKDIYETSLKNIQGYPTFYRATAERFVGSLASGVLGGLMMWENNRETNNDWVRPISAIQLTIQLNGIV